MRCAGNGIRRIAGSTGSGRRSDRATPRSTAPLSRARTQASLAGPRHPRAPPAAQTAQTPPCFARPRRTVCGPVRHRHRSVFRWKEAWRSYWGRVDPNFAGGEPGVPARPDETSVPPSQNLCDHELTACRTKSVSAPVPAPGAAYARTACAVAQFAMLSCFADREQYPDPLPREHSPDLDPESLPSAPRRASPRAPSAAAPDLPTAEASRYARWTPPTHAARLPLLVPTILSPIPHARAPSLFRACRHSLARTPRSVPLQIQAREEPSLRRLHLRPLPSYLPLPPS